MIEINLLPGAKKAKRGGGGGPSINFAAIGAAISARVKDKFLGAAVLSSIIAFTAIALLFLSQRNREANIRTAEAKAVEDSTRYAAVLKDRGRAQARRDSALIQLNIIRAIDEDRFIWPHVMDEVSRALPIYTWLRALNYSGTAQGLNPPAAMKAPPAEDPTKPSRKKRAEPVIPRDTVHLRIVGRTVDIQAFTRFMRSLEDSPFIGGVTLQKSEIQLEGGKEVTQFTLDATYTRPDTALLRRAPLTLTSR
ncbi:MAG TPA: PilN domain-containing protein [Gemmatimonadaceae bacterium]|nr:PilN domain-containing protein [Gemmatimonadaceae bacterium]